MPQLYLKTQIAALPVSQIGRLRILAVSINYRLTEAQANDQITDVAAAFAWVYRHSARFGGDLENIFVFGHSAGAALLAQLATDPKWLSQLGLSPNNIRGAILAGPGGIDASHVSAMQPASLLLDGDQGLERQIVPLSARFDAASVAAGAQVQWDIIAGRDHLTLLANMALRDDPGSQAMLAFVSAHLAPSAPFDEAATDLPSAGDYLQPHFLTSNEVDTATRAIGFWAPQLLGPSGEAVDAIMNSWEQEWLSAAAESRALPPYSRRAVA